MMVNEEIHKSVDDLGMAAYVQMYGHELLGRRGKSYFFQCANQKVAEEFDELVFDYQFPNEFYIFDSCLMFLKRLSEKYGRIKPEYRQINGLGCSAYVMMHEGRSNRLGTKVKAKSGSAVFFDCSNVAEDSLNKIINSWIGSQFRKFDDNLKALKESPEYFRH